ncbi:hypothetical protein [Kitasatospora sp. NPDC056531]|uniref:hypothetical protein n=1 Tax=Kitasatospora sp. NPDC056531 TaxID=3345856 RepID=UPI003684487F
MAFEDALRAARRAADERVAAETARAQERAQREREFQQKAERLVREALPHLLPHGSDVVIAVTRAERGLWRDRSGYLYREVGRQRCWVFGHENARPGLRLDAPAMDCPLVVTDDGRAWRVWCNLLASYSKGEFVTSIPPVPLSREAVTHRTDGTSDWTNRLEADLAAAVVSYERR